MLALAAPLWSRSQLIRPPLLTRVPVDGLAVPIGTDVLVAAELALRRHSLLVRESQVAAALADQASIRTIAIAIPGAFEVPTAMQSPPPPPPPPPLSHPVQYVPFDQLICLPSERGVPSTNCHWGSSDGVRVHGLEGPGGAAAIDFDIPGCGRKFHDSRVPRFSLASSHQRRYSDGRH